MLSSRVKRISLLVLGAIECLFFGGWIYGWASLVFVFKQEGYFLDKCPPVESAASHVESTPSGRAPSNYSSTSAEMSTTTTTDSSAMKLPGCDEQDAALQLVFTLAHFSLSVASFPLGLLYDRKGPLVIRVLLSVLMLAGCLMFALSPIITQYLLYPAAICIAVGGIQILVVNMQIPNLFGRGKWIVITIYSGCFDSSAFVFLVVKVLYEEYDVSVQIIFFVLAGTTLLFTFNTFLLPKRATIPYPLPDGYPENTRPEKGREVYASEPMHVYSNEITVTEEIETQESKNDGTIVDGGTRKNEETDKNRNDVISSNDAEPGTADLGDNTDGHSNPLTEDFPSLGACFLSVSFALLYVWFSVLQLDLVFLVSTLNPVLRRLADDHDDEEIVSQYTNTFAFIQLCGVLCAPFSGLLLSRNKGGNRCKHQDEEAVRLRKRGPYSDMKDAALVYAVCTSICIAFCVCGVLQVLEVQYATMALYVVGRSFLYSLAIAGCSLFFPGNYFGAIYGLILGLSTVFSLLQYPLFIITQELLDNDDFWVKIALLGVSVLTYSHPIFVFFYARKKEKLLKQEQLLGKTSTSG